MVNQDQMETRDRMAPQGPQVNLVNKDQLVL